MKTLKRLIWLFLILCMLIASPIAIAIWGMEFYLNALESAILKLK